MSLEDQRVYLNSASARDWRSRKGGVWLVQYRSNRHMRREAVAEWRQLMSKRRQTWNRIAAKAARCVT